MTISMSHLMMGSKSELRTACTARARSATSMTLASMLDACTVATSFVLGPSIAFIACRAARLNLKLSAPPSSTDVTVLEQYRLQMHQPNVPLHLGAVNNHRIQDGLRGTTRTAVNRMALTESGMRRPAYGLPVVKDLIRPGRMRSIGGMRTSVSTRWSGVSPTWRSVAPVRCASICIGTITLWCSATDTMICAAQQAHIYCHPRGKLASLHKQR